ncbi:MAG: hypothetical protein H6858_03985 [Rhodospirillales bacterium]|nr:hypothetical protein [Alphaproteobacteria bacterium]MCB9976746.1 hypothetical protein [Rhodospirillales bacterium]
MKIESLRYSAFVFVSALYLSGCVTTSLVNTGFQDVQISLQGADHAMCRAHNGIEQFTVFAPGTLQVKKSTEPLRLSCSAHNRTVDMTIPATVEEKPVWSGSSNGYDLKTSASYPPAVSVDFGVFNGTSYTAPVPAVEAESAVSAAMLPEPPSDPVVPQAAPGAAPAPGQEGKGAFMSVLKKLSSDSEAETAEEDSDVVEIKPNGPISLYP